MKKQSKECARCQAGHRITGLELAGAGMALFLMAIMQGLIIP